MRTPLFLMGSCLLSLTAPLQGQEVGPAGFNISSITVGGSGCRENSFTTNVAPDRMSFALTFYENIAESGPGIDLKNGIKNCQITLNLSVPVGWRFAVAGFDYRGYIKLDEGVEALHNTKYYIQGAGPGTTVTNTKKGPEDNPFFYQQQVKIDDRVWSPCDKERAMNINMTMRVWNADRERFPNAYGVIGTDSAEGSFQKWKLSWSRCP